MTELKFRAYHKVIKKMLPVHKLSFGIKPLLIYSLFEGTEIVNTINDVELMQYTGLTDKNGVEIYKDDILEYDGEKCQHCNKLLYDNHRPYTIVWKEKEAQFECENDENSMLYTIWGTDMKVIGNKHENKDLLK